MSRLGSFVTIGTLLLGCHSDPDLADYGRRWATAVCERWSACGCEPADCEAEQQAAFIERWDPEDDTDLPDPNCFDDRIEAIEELSCDFVETDDPFTWERAACPLYPNFRGLGEACGYVPQPGGSMRGPCGAGLVCDATSNTCVTSAQPPGLQQPCITSGDGSPDDWLCTVGLICVDGLCIESADRTREPSPPIACNSIDVF